MARSSDWRDVPGFPDYVACSDGRVARVVGHKSGNGYRHVELPGKLEGNGHSVGTRPSSRHKFRVYVHHIIAFTFLGAPSEGKTKINHKDNDRANNDVSNIEWCTQAHNIQQAWNTGRIPRKRLLRLPAETVIKLLALRQSGLSYTRIASELKVHPTTVGYQVRAAAQRSAI